jgi:hypothetical protein
MRRVEQLPTKDFPAHCFNGNMLDPQLLRRGDKEAASSENTLNGGVDH